MPTDTENPYAAPRADLASDRLRRRSRLWGIIALALSTGGWLGSFIVMLTDVIRHASAEVELIVAVILVLLQLLAVGSSGRALIGRAGARVYSVGALILALSWGALVVYLYATN